MKLMSTATNDRAETRDATVWSALMGRRDVIFGSVTGFAVALAFGTPILAALAVFWSGYVLPAFYTLAQAGLAFCG